MLEGIYKKEKGVADERKREHRRSRFSVPKKSLFVGTRLVQRAG